MMIINKKMHNEYSLRKWEFRRKFEDKRREIERTIRRK